MVAEAVVDCRDEDEQQSGLFAMPEEHLALPFGTAVLGVPVTVKAIDSRPAVGIVAVCVPGQHRQVVGLLDLPLPDPAPEGAEWIEAYRLWVG